MKKLLAIYLFAIALILSTSSCAIHSGYMVPSASLSTNNFSYIHQDLWGSAKITYFLFFGGSSRMALVNEAKQDLLEDFPLSDNEALVNLTVNWQKTYNLFTTTNRCTITADIVRFK